MSEITEALQRIEVWLQNHMPNRAAELRPGLTRNEINELVKDLPFNLPDEVYELYQWHDGSVNRFILENYDFLPFINCIWPDEGDNCAVDKITKYRDCVIKLLTSYVNDDISENEVEVQLLLDTERNHYQWMNVGWEELNHIYRCVMHFDIKNGKIWLQQNLTDLNPAEELVEMGIPREDIVLGLQAPYKRQYTDYGVALKFCDY